MRPLVPTKRIEWPHMLSKYNLLAFSPNYLEGEIIIGSQLLRKCNIIFALYPHIFNFHEEI
jgi:hypothetical protein